MTQTIDLMRGVHRTLRNASRVVTMSTRRYRDLPDFLIIGAQRCGTTSMYKYLAQHPAVAPAVLSKGVHYFDVNYTRGDAWYRSHFPSRPYKALLSERSGQRALTGEGSPYYLFHPAVPSRVATTVPNVRLIAMLRNPISRAYSQYQHEVARGFEKPWLRRRSEDGRGTSCRRGRALVRRPQLLQLQSSAPLVRLSRHLRRSAAPMDGAVPQDQILIVDSGDFFAQPERAYRDVLSFLGLRDHSLERSQSQRASLRADVGQGARVPGDGFRRAEPCAHGLPGEPVQLVVGSVDGGGPPWEEAGPGGLRFRMGIQRRVAVALVRALDWLRELISRSHLSSKGGRAI